ncbi:unnamed protein product, partial [Scytosiphon promiscuus]
MTLTRAFLAILEGCYDEKLDDGRDRGGCTNNYNGGDGGDRPLGPGSWPWNTEAKTEITRSRPGAEVVSDRWHPPPPWPVSSLSLWGPRLADVAGDRESRSSGGSAAVAVVDRAARVVELVLRRHAGEAWKQALSALRPSRPVVPLCGPLLERICLELPLMALPVRVHAAVFEAHGWLSLLPCGDSAIRAAEGRGGQPASRALANLHSGRMSQFGKLFVPYVQGLTKIVKDRGASVSPALLPEVVPSIFQALLAPVPAARAAIEELLSCSVFADGEPGTAAASDKRGDRLRRLLERLPLECARVCFLAVPQALGAMAAAGPHLSLKSWPPLFHAVGALGRAVLLPPPPPGASHTSREESGVGSGGRSGSEEGRGVMRDRRGGQGSEVTGGGGGDGSSRRGGGALEGCSRAAIETAEMEGEEDGNGELWDALGAVWEFIFLQVLPEALPALRAQHATRLEEACVALFGSLESLWPLLTGPVPQRRRPRLADDFYRSRSLWLQPLLSWVSERWLPLPARAAAADFVQRSLLPFLHAALAPSTRATAEAVGRALLLSADAEEAKLLLELRSAAASATSGIAEHSPVRSVGTPEGPVSPVFGMTRSVRSPTAQRNPFVRTAAPRARASLTRGGDGSPGTGGGFLRTPWEQRLGAGNSVIATAPAPAGGAASEAESVASLAQLTRSSAPAPLFQREVTARVRTTAAEARRGAFVPAAAGGSRGDPPLAGPTGRSSPVSDDAESFELGDAGAPDEGKRYVTAAEAAAARASRAERAEAVAAAARPRGSVVERWREMQRRQAGETATALAPRAVPARPGQKQQADSRKDVARASSAAVASAAAASTEARAAFAAAAKAQARRAGRSTRDFASLAEASSMELHRLVLSSWTVPELADESSSSHPARGGRGGAFQGEAAREDHGSSRSSMSRRLWLSRVPTRFQSVEQYLEVVTLRVSSFVEGGKDGFGHVTMVADDGGGGPGGGGTYHRFGHDDVLLLSLAEPQLSRAEDGPSMAAAGADRGTGEGDSTLPAATPDTLRGKDGTAPACLAIFEKEPRGGRRGAAGSGPQGGGRSSVRAKVLFRSAEAAARGRDRSSPERQAGGPIPKKASRDRHGDGGEEPGEASGGHSGAMLRAFREPGSQVRVTRLEGLSTSTREFVALEASPRAALLHHILQSEPSLKLRQKKSRRRGTTNTIDMSPNLQGALEIAWSPLLAPQGLAVYEVAFLDACKRLSSVEECTVGTHGKNRDGRGVGGSADRRRGGSVPDIDAAASTELMMRSLRCLASFRVTPDLLSSHGRSTAKRLKHLTTAKSYAWGPEVPYTAARLLRAWRSVVAASAGGSGGGASTPSSQAAGRAGGSRGGGRAGERGSADAADKMGAPSEAGMGVESSPTVSSVGHKLGALVHGSDGAASPRLEHSSNGNHPPPMPRHSPRRPSLVPAELWDRLSQEFNVSQLTAIWASAASASEGRKERTGGAADPHISRWVTGGAVVLLQGPPGTGKTRTVLGVVSAILARREEKTTVTHGGGGDGVGGIGDGSRNGVGDRGMGTTLEVAGTRKKRPGVAGRWVAAKTHQRILVCAPSNGAVDELAQRLALEAGGVWNNRGKPFAPRVVRLGKPSEEAASRVKAVSLEAMVEERLKLHAKSAEASNAEAKIRETHARIDEAGRALRGGGDSVGEVVGVPGIGSVENRRHQLNAHIRRLRGELLVAKQRRRDALRGLEVERTRIRRSLISNAQVVCATLSGCGSGPLVEAVSLSGKGFDTVIVDEACQATELSTLIPLCLGCKRLILVGDPRQLPATVISQRAARLNLEISLFERLERAGHPVHMLTVQYRMHPEIRAFPSERFYEGRLTDAPCVRERADQGANAKGSSSKSSSTTSSQPSSPPDARASPLALPPPPLGPCFPPFLLVDVSTGSERRVGNSYQNPLEASFVAAFLSRLVTYGLREGRGLKGTGGGGGEGNGVVSVGVITPYRGQVHRIRQELEGSRRLKGGIEDGGVDVEVSTVDGFQGKEVDIVLFSCVRAPPPSYNAAGHGTFDGRRGGGGGGGIGFLADRRRMNVAITRAKRSLIVLGNARRLSSDSTWKALVDHARSNERLEPEVSAEAAARGAGGWGRNGGGGGGDLANSGKALCDRLDAKYDAARGRGSAARRPSSHNVGGGKKKIETRKADLVQHQQEDQRGRRGTSDRDDRRGGGEKKPSGSTRGADSDGRGGGAAATKEQRQGQRSEDGEIPRQEADGEDNSTDGHRRQRSASPRASERRPRPAAAEPDGGRRRGRELAPPTPQERRANRAGAAEAVLEGATAEGSASAGQKRREGEAERPQKRARVARADATRRGGTVIGGSSRDYVPGSERAAAPAAAGGGGFLEGLLSSLNANASGISSGKEHDFRQGLRGGEDGERRRAAAGPPLGGARVTELSRPAQPTQAPPARSSPRANDSRARQKATPVLVADGADVDGGRVRGLHSTRGVADAGGTARDGAKGAPRNGASSSSNSSSNSSSRSSGGIRREAGRASQPVPPAAQRERSSSPRPQLSSHGPRNPTVGGGARSGDGQQQQPPEHRNTKRPRQGQSAAPAAVAWKATGRTPSSAAGARVGGGGGATAKPPEARARAAARRMGAAGSGGTSGGKSGGGASR